MRAGSRSRQEPCGRDAALIVFAAALAILVAVVSGCATDRSVLAELKADPLATASFDGVSQDRVTTSPGVSGAVGSPAEVTRRLRATSGSWEHGAATVAEAARRHGWKVGADSGGDPGTYKGAKRIGGRTAGLSIIPRRDANGQETDRFLLTLTIRY